MKLIPYQQIQQLMIQGQYDVTILLKSVKLEEICFHGLGVYYRNDNKTRMYAYNALARQLSFLSHPLEGQIAGKTILDLGCGNNDFLDTDPSLQTRQFEPWLCRALKIIDANPIGVDYGNLETETFTHYTINLAEPNCLAMLPDHSVDLANASFFFNSPILNFLLNLNQDRVRQNILPQLERILKPDAAFIYSE